MNPILAHGPPPSIIAVGMLLLLMYYIAPIVSIVLGLRRSARRGLGVILALLPIGMNVYLAIELPLEELTESWILAVVWLTPAILGFVGFMINLRKRKDA